MARLISIYIFPILGGSAVPKVPCKTWLWAVRNLDANFPGFPIWSVAKAEGPDPVNFMTEFTRVVPATFSVGCSLRMNSFSTLLRASSVVEKVGSPRWRTFLIARLLDEILVFPARVLV